MAWPVVDPDPVDSPVGKSVGSRWEDLRLCLTAINAVIIQSARLPDMSNESHEPSVDVNHVTSAAREGELRDIAEVPAVEVITTTAVHLMSAAAIKCGLADGSDAGDLKDLDEARKLITALAGLVTAGATEIGDRHARPLRDGLRTLQLAFREASPYPDAPGKGPGEQFTGAVS